MGNKWQAVTGREEERERESAAIEPLHKTAFVDEMKLRILRCSTEAAQEIILLPKVELICKDIFELPG